MARIPERVHAQLAQPYTPDEALVPRAMCWRLGWSDLGPQDRVAVIDGLIGRGLSLAEVAEHLGCHTRTVKEWRPLVAQYPHLASRPLTPRSVRSPL